MDPVSAAVLGGANVLGGAMQGAVNEKTAKAGLNVEQLLGQRGLDVQSAAVGDQIRRQMESMPLRDRLLAQLQARMGQAPAGFNPAGMWGNANHPASTGGVDQGALQRAAANYQPGTGGTRPDIAAQMMNRLGYTPMGGSAFSQGGNEWQKTLGQKFGSAPQSWANTLVGTESGNLNTDPLRWASANVGHAGNQMTGLASTPGGGGQPEVFTNDGSNPINGLPSGDGTSTGVIGNGIFPFDRDSQPPTPPPSQPPTPPPGGGPQPPPTTPHGMFPSLPMQPPSGGNSLKDIAARWGGTLNPQPPTPESPVASVQPPTGGPPPVTGFTPNQLFPPPTNPATPPSPSVPPAMPNPDLFPSFPIKPPPPSLANPDLFPFPIQPPPSNPTLPPSGGAPPGPPVTKPPSMFQSLPNTGTPPPTNPAVPLPPQPPTPPTTPAIPSWQKAVAGKLMPRTPF